MTEFQTNVLRHFYDDYPRCLVPEMSSLNDNLSDAGLTILQVRGPPGKPDVEAKAEPASALDFESLDGLRRSATASRLTWTDDGAAGFIVRCLCALMPASAIGCLFVFW